MELHPLPLPMGEAAERSEDGEGTPGCNTLSVTFGDSSPGGGAKGLYLHVGAKMERICIDTLHSLFYAPRQSPGRLFFYAFAISSFSICHAR